MQIVDSKVIPKSTQSNGVLQIRVGYAGAQPKPKELVVCSINSYQILITFQASELQQPDGGRLPEQGQARPRGELHPEEVFVLPRVVGATHSGSTPVTSQLRHTMWRHRRKLSTVTPPSLTSRNKN